MNNENAKTHRKPHLENVSSIVGLESSSLSSSLKGVNKGFQPE